VVRVLRTHDQRLWLAAGLVSGITLMNKPLIVFLLASLGASMLLVGPRSALRSAWLWAGLFIALALWSPWLAWQASHGWPQLEVSSSISSGGSGSSQPRWALLPFQLLLVSPVLAPVWISGLLALLRRERFRQFRLFAVAWVLLVLAFVITGGKPYYLAGMFPALLAAGSVQVDAWLSRSVRSRATLLWAMVALSGAVSAVLALPLLPARDAGPANAANSDVGETIGWPELARRVASVYRRAGTRAVIFTANYGEAGAIDRYGAALGLPSAFSGHNAFAEWGPPKVPPGPVVTVGIHERRGLSEFRGCRLAATVDNSAGIGNEERGEPIELCRRPAASWARVWPHLRHYG
jgi:4-amino-4-deoxy-L-arabinose transferase-like glycosyltransferase